MTEPMLKTGLQGMECRVAIVLPARIAVDAGVLREGPQRLLQLQVLRVTRIGQLESRSDDHGIVQDGTDGLTKKVSVNGPVLRIKLVLGLLSRKQLHSDARMIARAEH